jgi:hypothetical protein
VVNAAQTGRRRWFAASQSWAELSIIFYSPVVGALTSTPKHLRMRKAAMKRRRGSHAAPTAEVLAKALDTELVMIAEVVYRHWRCNQRSLLSELVGIEKRQEREGGGGEGGKQQKETRTRRQRSEGSPQSECIADRRT